MVYPGFGRPFRATHLGLCRDRPCGALYYLLWLTQGLVALSGLRTLGFVGVAPIGAYPSCWSKAAVRSASASIRLEQGRSVLGQCVCPFGETYALQHPDT